MKKLTSLLLLLLIFSITLLGCTSKGNDIVRKEKAESKIKIVDKIFKDSNGYEIINTGIYYLFSTNSKETYVEFLDSLDVEVYEIIDIDIESFGYFITYTNKSLIKIIK